MSFTPESFTKKLAGLQETQDSIVTISQWILFHHRHSKDSARIWSEYILGLDSSPRLSSKKLSLLYLCNDVVQQARHKRKSEFIRNFAEVLPNVFNRVYPSIVDSTRPKVVRLIDVWEQRSVFAASEIKELRRAIELSKRNKRLDDVKDDQQDDTNGSSVSGGNQITIAPEINLANTTLNHINQLNDSNQSILQQISLQSKTHLPTDPSASDNLPSPRIYISKLNVLDKLCITATSNINTIKKERQSLLQQLESLVQIVNNALETDDSKLALVQKTKDRLVDTRLELQSMIEDESDDATSASVTALATPTASTVESPEEPSPAFDDDDDDDDMIPTYEDEDSDDDLPPSKKQKITNTSNSHSRSPSISSGNSTPSSKKSVAFSEDVEIKEYEREERTDFISIAKSDDEQGDDEGFEEDAPSDEYTKHHKDDLELKHEHEEDEYEPHEPSGVQVDVLSILSKLAEP
ncbi:regulator of Ty1 transposition protein 103 [[Candida] anglica]